VPHDAGVSAWSLRRCSRWRASREDGRPAPATPLSRWRFPDISAVEATIHFAKEVQVERLHPSEQQANINKRIPLRIPSPTYTS